MIVIDGCQSNICIENFSNLEEILVKVMEDEALSKRIVTDVIVNDEAFSEIYPHQAEDFETNEIKRIELKTVSQLDFAGDVTTELFKIISILQSGSIKIAQDLRAAKNDEALLMIQDLFTVTSNFLNMIAVLREQFQTAHIESFSTFTNKFTSVLEELIEAIENEDWILLSDLLEYEFNPVCVGWNQILEDLSKEIEKARG
ncbi:hypothetical protein [Desulfovibrio litoralis]|uniref:Uncharacterized protein n=1 Tax=Desulfovibrio litoralis DSM 11393 TaxID=1121455 RepID=A0A1M7TIA9_9BACT|nr:hypothetical protein [Desulfovibrio litoralis]SHN70455.1 hypothetical protein SAMN02745728_02046 [Desulfovibrio litoralis DSM 11393]